MGCIFRCGKQGADLYGIRIYAYIKKVSAKKQIP